MKKLLSFLLVVLMALGCVACTKPNPDNGPDGPSTPLTRLRAPTVSVNRDGLATWNAVGNATGYCYKITVDGAEPVENNVAKDVTSTQMTEVNSTIQVKALGDGVTYSDSNYSIAAKYEGAFSYVLDNSGSEVLAISVYTTEGTSVLGGIKSDKHGSILQEGIEYIIELDATLGAYSSGMLFAGVEDAVISDVVWSNRSYSDREGEKTVADKLAEVKYHVDNNYASNTDGSGLGYGDYNNLHRSWWGSFWGEGCYGWTLGADAKLTDGVYDTTVEGFWKEATNDCATMWHEHWLSTKKSSGEASKELKVGVDDLFYLRMKIKFNSFDKIAGPDYSMQPEGGALLGRTGFNFFTRFNSSFYYAFFDGSYYTRELTTETHVVDENGEASKGVNIYDKATGDLVYAGMDAAATAKLLALDKEYVFEFDISDTTANDTPLLLAGTEGSLITESVFSDVLWPEAKSGDSSARSIVWKLADWIADAHTGANVLYHRLKLQGDKYTVTATNANKYNSCIELYNTVPVFSADAEGEVAYVGTSHYLRMTVKFESFFNLGATTIVRDASAAKYGQLAAVDCNMFLHHRGGSYSLFFGDAITPSAE